VLRLVKAIAPDRLFAAAASEFLVHRPATATEPFPTPPTWLAVRQGGLRDDLYRLATRRSDPRP
jgi:hypothetical protein